MLGTGMFICRQPASFMYTLNESMSLVSKFPVNIFLRANPSD